MSEIPSSSGLKLTDRAHPPADTAQLGAEALDMLSAARNIPEQSMGELVQLRDYQNPKDIERMRQALEREAAEILSQVDTAPCEMIPYHGAGIDGMGLEKGE
jgi:hypothetical protein